MNQLDRPALNLLSTWQVKQYQTTYPDELGVVVANSIKQKEQLDLILLEFRKLREGIISSGREDAFAVEVYETSAKLAILSRNLPQISTILPHLVRRLHRLDGGFEGLPSPTGSRAADTLHGRLERVSIATPLPTSMDTRARFASYYMLHTLLLLENLPAFQDLLREFVDFSATTDDGTLADGRIPASNPHVRFVLEAFRLASSNDYVALSSIIANPFKYDKFAWILTRSALAARQDKAWQALKAGYLSTTDRHWLARSLCLTDEAALLDWLIKRQLEHHIKPDSTILLKHAAPGPEVSLRPYSSSRLVGPRPRTESSQRVQGMHDTRPEPKR